jgi:eukaryotic-like serine/threonine-protein kinase
MSSGGQSPPSRHANLGPTGHDGAVKRLGRYQIIGRLATGGMAEVYLALSGELTGFRTLVVVKRILPHLASNGQFIRMFLDEARLASLLDHPNIVRIIEVGHDGEDYFLAMELVQGKPLSALLRKAAREHRPPSPALTSYIVAQAASGLAYAHALTDGDGRTLGVVHRDVSPQNVLISFEGAVKLIDFGVARAFGRVAHTNPGGLKGKIDYMSPEQASAEDVDHRADVFALGVVLWEAATGKRLFRRDTELATMRAIVDDAIPHPSEVAEVPEELDAIIMRALRKRRDARFASAHEMAVALERFAFTHDGFSPLQVASYTKSLFAAEYLQWRKTATSALDLEVEPSQIQAQGVLAPEPMTAGPTMALRPGVSWADGRSELRSSSERSRSSPSRPRAPEPQSQASNAGVSSRRDRIWVYGGLTLLASVMVAGAWLLARPAEMAGTGTTQAPVEVATPAAIVEPLNPVVPVVGAEPAPIPTAAPSNVKPPIEATATTVSPVIPAVTVTDVKPATPADPSSWKALSRSGKGKASGARRAAHRDKPAASDSDDKNKDVRPGSKKPDPFAD